LKASLQLDPPVGIHAKLLPHRTQQNSIMATYFTFFLSRTEELPAAFPDWKKPLTQPVLCTKMNPFTGETMTISTRAPKWDDAAPDWMEAREPKVAQGMGDYPPYLESRLPPFVQA